MPKYCSECGKELIDNPNFCPECRKEIKEEQRKPIEKRTEPVDEVFKKKYKEKRERLRTILCANPLPNPP